MQIQQVFWSVAVRFGALKELLREGMLPAAWLLEVAILVLSGYGLW